MNAWLPGRPRSRRPFPSASEGGAAPEVTPTYEGRPFHRPAEDVEDQGVAFDIGTLVSRRSALGVFGAGAGALVLAACGAGTTSSSATSGAAGTTAAASAASTAATTSAAASSSGGLTEMVTETAGPYPGDGSNGPDVLEASGVERSDITTSIDSDTAAEGVPLTVTMNLIDLANGDGALAGAAVYLWHCDAQGRYSMYSDGVTEETYLRGVQVAGDDGTVTFTTIFPGCYSGRWPHLHFEVFPDLASVTDATNNVLTSQIALPAAESELVYADSRYTGSAANLAQVSLETDGIFADSAEQQLPQISGSVSKGFAISIDVPIDTTTEQQMASMGGGAGGPGGQRPTRP